MEKELADLFRDQAARIFALQAGLMAAFKTHPLPTALADALARCEDAGMSNMLYQWEDGHLDLYRKTVQQLRD
jgi:hypothetical protein